MSRAKKVAVKNPLQSGFTQTQFGKYNALNAVIGSKNY